MADLDVDEYPPTEASSELLNRPTMEFTIGGQAEFLGLVFRLGIPVLAGERNINVMMLPTIAGEGNSFAVSRFNAGFESIRRRDYVNHTKFGWFADETRETSTIKLRHVTKRIRTRPHEQFSDAQHLASIVNEIRVLSNDVLRQSPQIVNLFAISWYETPDQGRYWPQLLLESATYGTLDAYARSEKITFQMNCMLALDILSGLEFLHHCGITHCDIKPSNILIFESKRNRDATEIEEFLGLKPVHAKLSDFGISVIHSDYPKNATFQARMGTFPWMAPELESSPNGRAIELSQLHSTDVYSFGLVLASMLIEHVPIFDSYTAEQIIALKLSHDPADSAYVAVCNRIVAVAGLDDAQLLFVADIFARTLQPLPESRSSIGSLMNLIKHQIIEALHEMIVQLFESVGSPLSAGSNPSIAPTSSGKWLSRLGTTISNSVQSVFGLATTILSGSNSRPVNKETFNLHDFLFKARLPAINRVSDNESLANDGESGQAEKEEVDVEVDDSKASERTKCPLPDFCFQYPFNAGQLPAVGAREVLADLHRQSKLSGCSAEVYYQLAGCYCNGSMVRSDSKQALGYFIKAARAKHRRALHSSQNFFASYGMGVPAEVVAICKSVMAEEGRPAASDFVHYTSNPNIAQPLRLDQCLNTTWAQRDFEDDPDGVTEDNRNRFQTSVLRYMRVHQPLWPKTAKYGAFDFNRLPSCRNRSPPFLSSKIDTSAFKKEVKKFQCVELSSHFLVTLLQDAVCSGDTIMVDILIDELQAEVDNYGHTPGWTPLWLACFSGQFELAMKLLAKGASPMAQDQQTGFTIFHLLNQFLPEQNIGAFVKKILDSGKHSSLISAKSHHGLTPLHATFIGWDYSNGRAARVLLQHGADPTIAAPNGENTVTPIGLCVTKLNHELLQDMLACPLLMRRRQHPAFVRAAVADAKGEAYRALCGTRTEFYFRSIVGRDWEESLTKVLHLIIDEPMRLHLANHEAEWKRCDDLLGSALHCSSIYLAKALIKSSIENVKHSTPRRSILSLAIERGMEEMSMLLLESGAELFDTDEVHPTMLHFAAHYRPHMLESIIGYVELAESSQKRGRSTREIMEYRNTTGFDVVGLLIAEHDEAHLALVDRLRVRFQLDLDANSIAIGDETFTLTGTLIKLNTLNGLIPLSQIRYLLDLSPRPRFICGSKGTSVLSSAVTGESAYQNSLTNIGHQMTQLILDRYEDVSDDFNPDKHGFVTHLAAASANIVALTLIQSWFERAKNRNPVLPVQFADVANALDSSKSTALSYVADLLPRPSRKIDHPDLKGFSYPTLNAQQKSSALRCYKLLREAGGLLSTETKGHCLRIRVVEAEKADTDGWTHFVCFLKTSLGLGRVIFDNELVTYPSDTSKSEAETVANPKMENSELRDTPRTSGKFRALELIWLVDEFALRSYSADISGVDVTGNVQRLISSRKQQNSAVAWFKNLDPDKGVEFWNVQRYEETIPLGNFDIVEWTRRGKIWRWEEVQDLCARFGKIWMEIFGGSSDVL